MSEYLSFIWDDRTQTFVNIGGSSFARIYYDTKAHWNAKSTLKSEKQALYVYTDQYEDSDGQGGVTYTPGVKIGDGSAYLIDIPFIDAHIVKMVTDHIGNDTIHVTAAEKAFWNSKHKATVVDGNLIFTDL